MISVFKALHYVTYSLLRRLAASSSFLHTHLRVHSYSCRSMLYYSPHLACLVRFVRRCNKLVRFHEAETCIAHYWSASFRIGVDFSVCWRSAYAHYWQRASVYNISSYRTVVPGICCRSIANHNTRWLYLCVYCLGIWITHVSPPSW